VTVFDVSDRTAPSAVQQSYSDGWYLSSRAVGNDVYVVVQNTLALPAPAVHTSATDYSYETEAEYRARLAGHVLDLALPHDYTQLGDAQHPAAPTGFVSQPEDICQPLSASDTNLVSVLAFDVS